MDPFTSFSLVCGIIQVVDLSVKSVSKCEELYQAGSLSEYQELEDLINRLVDDRDKLETTTAEQKFGIFGQAEDQSLLEVAGQCLKTAEHLVEKFRSLTIEGPHENRHAVFETVKSLWKKGELQEIQRRLDGYRNVLDTQILKSLRYVCFGCPLSNFRCLELICSDWYEDRQRLNLVSLQQSKDFQKIDQEVQNLINNVSQRQKDSEQLKNLILNENKEIKNNISMAEQDQHTRLLQSLWFPEVLHQEGTNAEAYRKTFEWIYDNSGRAVRPWNDFVAWLENGEGIYWISGKAGSGKSTLMNLLCHDERTQGGLEIWSGTQDILTAKFFFSSGGNMMQKNLTGLLRSLLWQILREIPDVGILPTSAENRLEQKRRKVDYSQDSLSVWTKDRLHMTLQEAIHKLRGSCHLCFFIDGLDEFDDDKDELIEFLQNIVSNAGIKACLSSRPEKEFEDAFGSSARLRLQDLTHEDIRHYVDDRFQNVPQLVSIASGNEYVMNKLKEQIVDGAEGVFSWVSLAVKDQIDGFRMLDRIDSENLREASSILKMALCEPNLSVLELALASHPGLEDMLSSADEISKQRMIYLCRSTRHKMKTRCEGLLEIHEDPDRENTDKENADKEDIERQTINDRAHTFDTKQSEASSEVDMSAFDFKRETRDDLNREHESRQPHGEPGKRGPASRLKPEISDAETLTSEMFTVVTFVHREVVEFLKRPIGEAFLDTSLWPGFDPQVQTFKAKLAVKRLTEEINSRKAMVEDENKNLAASTSGRESPTSYSQTTFVDSAYASRAYSTANSKIQLEQTAHLGEQMRSRVTVDDEIQSIASDQDETESQDPTGRLPQSALAKGLLANLLAKNNELIPLYKEALSLMEVRRFVDNFQRLLRQCYLDLRQNAKGNLELATCRLLKGQESRTKIAARIAGLYQPENDETHENMRRQADEDQSRAFHLERWIADNRGLRHTALSADTPGPVPDDKLEEQEENSSEEDASEDGNEETNHPHITEMGNFITGGDAFKTLVTNFRIFLLPTSLRSFTRIIMSVPTNRIQFVDSDDLSFSNKIKIFVESITEDNWNWWPLRPKMKMLKKNQTRLLWQCVSDMSR